MSTDKHMLADGRRSDRFMAALWIGFLLAGVGIFGVLIYKIFTYTEDPKTQGLFTPAQVTRNITPRRGDILDCKGRILATSSFVYDIYLDCKLAPDSVWNTALGPLSDSLSRIFSKRSKAAWKKYLSGGRASGQGGLEIALKASFTETTRMRTFPLFCLGQFKGGLIVREKEQRFYPYGTLALRTIGYVRDNSKAGKWNDRIGIEGACDSCLHGVDGQKIMRRSDFGYIPTGDEDYVEAVPGRNVRTTLDIDIQSISDRALRRRVEENELIEKSCVIVLDSRSGAVRAMVNLGRDKKGNISERDNYAVKNAEAPGSIFKGALTMALLEEGYVTSLEQKVPTYGGKWEYNGVVYDDTKHVGRSRYPGGYIKIREAFEMSANNPFRQLLCDERTFGNNPERFVKKVKQFGLFDTLSFDLPGIAKPFILDPSMKKMTAKGSWDRGTLPGLAIGYGMELSPLNLVTFYNAIATRGVMYKPYLVDAIMEGGRVVEQREPEVLHGKICRREVADTLARVMGMVASDKNGTAYWQLKDAVCPIAGKTGTAQRVFRKSNGKYGLHDTDGTESQQGSFVGFFPKDNPEYTAIVVVWGRPSRKNLFGATWAAPVFREIADKIYSLNDGRQLH